MLKTLTQQSELELDQRVVFYPSFGCMDRDSRTWKIKIHGLVYEPARENLRKKVVVRVLRRVMKARDADFESEIFRSRIGTFVAMYERGIRVAIRVGDRTFALKKKSKRNGHFGGTLRLTRRFIEKLRRQGHIENGWLRFSAITPEFDARWFEGRCQLIEPEGVSVISDIDDTIKHSEVADRRSLLANTFLREFQSVPGMAESYRVWEGRGAAFHYVSSSPWQLFDSLNELCQREAFPEGSYHLRMLRIKDPRVLGLLMPVRWGKRRTIRSILKAFPQRRFVLVGDSGEKDPEIYAAAARRRPDQIAKILIRSLSDQNADPERYDKAFRGVSPAKWALFEKAADIAERLSARVDD